MKEDYKITVFSIVYNGYGKFIPQWNEYLNKQTIPVKKFVVLGHEHGADMQYLKDNNIDFIYYDSSVMGVLRNRGVERITTEWWFYFAIDDELLPHACEEIVNTDADAVSIRFNCIEPNGIITENQHSPLIQNFEQLFDWKNRWGGYTAVRGNTDLRYKEDIEVPNLTFHMDMFKRGLKVVESKSILVIHHRWSDSHHFRSEKDGSRRKYVKDIDDYAKQIYEELIERADKMIIEALIDYTDNTLGKEIKKGDRYEVSKERGKQILEATFKGNHYARIIELLEDKEKTIRIEVLKPTRDNITGELGKGVIVDTPMIKEPKKTTIKKKAEKKN